MHDAHDLGLPVVYWGCPLTPPLASCVHVLGMLRPWDNRGSIVYPRLPKPPLFFSPLAVGSPEGAGEAWQSWSHF